MSDGEIVVAVTVEPIMLLEKHRVSLRAGRGQKRSAGSIMPTIVVQTLIVPLNQRTASAHPGWNRVGRL